MLDAVLALNETDTKVFDFASQAAPPADEPAGHITVPNAHLLFNGDFQRVGTNDLKIVGDDGASYFIRDYFAADKLSHLISPEGATLSASVVAALAGPLAPGQSAQAGAQPAGQPVIGRVDALSGSCTVVRNGVSVVLNIGDTVRKGDVVQTAGGSAVAIVFADGSTFSLNANARMVLDEFVYNAGSAGNSALISLVQGTFSFVAGQVAKTGDMRVDTPVATMGIRGTAVLVEISANDGQTRFSVMTEPDGTTGSFNLYDKTSGTLIGTVSSSQIGWLVTPAGPLQVVAQQVQKTPAQLAQELGIVQQIFTIFNNNQQNPFTPDPNDPGRRGDNPNDPNPQTAQGGGGGSGGLLAGGDPSEGSPPGIVNGLPPSGTHVVKLPPLPGAPPPVIPDVVTVVVTPNAAPVAVNDPDGSSGGGDVIENDSDPEGSVIVVKTVRHIEVVEGGQEVPGPPVTVSAAGATIEGTYGTLTIHPDGTYTFSPHGETYDSLAEGVGAIDKFQYTISDPFGATATAVLSINLTGVNDAPVAVSDTANSAEGGSAGNVLANDTDPDTGDAISVVSARHVYGEGSGEPTPITGEGGTAIEGTYGTLYLHTDGTYTFEPNATFDSLPNGQQFVEKFEYTIEDEHGVEASAILSINLTGANDAPVATDDTAQNGPEGFPAGTVLANDADPEGDAISVTKVQHWVNGEPSGELITVNIEGSTPIEGTYGTLFLNADGTYTFEPNEAFASLSEGVDAIDQFQYTVTDEHGAASTAVLSVNLTGVNDAPYFSSLEGFDQTTDETSGPVAFDLLNHAEDVDTNDTLSAINIVASAIDHCGNVVTIPSNAVNIVGNKVTIDPSYFSSLNDGESVTVTVTVNYDLSDGHTTTHNTAKLVINGENESAAQNDTASMGENEVLFVDVLANDFAGTETSKTLTDLGDITITSPGHATLGTPAIAIENNQIRITPGTAFGALAVGEPATITVPYTMTANGIAYNAVATITVAGANNVPVITAATTSGQVSAENPISDVAKSYLSADHDLIDGLGGSGNFGEGILQPNDDGSTIGIDITTVFGEQGLNFFGNYFTSIYINNNGNITFNQPLSQYTPSQIAGGSGNPIIAPFWADVDTRGGTANPTPGGQSTGSNLVHYDLDALNGVITVTWDDVGYYNYHTTPPNAFQLQLVDRGNSDFDIVFRYEAINWTTGDASQGSGGLGGTPARAGYTAGDGNVAHYFELPVSGNQQGMLDLEEATGNTGKPGVYVFHVRSGNVETPTTIGTINFSDPDVTDTHTALTSFNASASNGASPHGTLQATVTHDTVSGTNGLVTWQYVADPDLINAIPSGTTIEEVHDVIISDGHGGTVTQQVTIALHGPDQGSNEITSTSNASLVSARSADAFVFSAETMSFQEELPVTFGSEQGTLTNFTQAQNSVTLYGLYDNFDHMVTSGAFNDAHIEANQIDLGGNIITVSPVAVSDLTDNDFIFRV